MLKSSVVSGQLWPVCCYFTCDVVEITWKLFLNQCGEKNRSALSCVRCFRWFTLRSLCTCKQETVWRPASGWRCWARSVAATRGAWPPSTRQITPVDRGSAAKTRVTTHRAASPAQRESLLCIVILSLSPAA